MNATKQGAEQSERASEGKAQLALFKSFVTNDQLSVTNLLGDWESVPKYILTAPQVRALRSPDGLSHSFAHPFVYRKQPCTVVLQPANLDGPEGEKSYYPGVTEELIEEILKKLLATADRGEIRLSDGKCTVRFTISMLRRELARHGKSRSHAEVRHALRVMVGTTITVLHDGKELWEGHILENVRSIYRSAYLEDDGDSEHLATFNSAVTKSILGLEYRQCNYDRIMACKSQLVRSLYKRFADKFTYADSERSYNFTYESVLNTGLLNRPRPAHNRKKIVEALTVLKNYGVLKDFTIKETKIGRRVDTVVYNVFAGSELIADQKASNKAKSQREQRFEAQRLPVPAGGILSQENRANVLRTALSDRT